MHRRMRNSSDSKKCRTMYNLHILTLNLIDIYTYMATIHAYLSKYCIARRLMKML